ncbi:SdpI family protein [Candidatus Parcubacteria bacterium]|jgi:uncharacterized membrane protein|nr:SdpI family protein [Candidatus Parcubacteria bacterium]
MKKKNIWELASCLLVVAVVLAAFYFYQYLPDKIVTHWNAAGEADGWGSKNMQIIFLPLLILFVHLLFKLLPKIDPKKKNYEKFANVYGIFRVAIVGYLAIIYFLTGFVNLGYDISISAVMPILIGLLFIVMGVVMKDIKPNWFMGIRTPWTLSNDTVWKKTHEFGGKTFVLSGLLFMLLGVLPEEWFGVGLIIVILLTLSSVVYSYFIYKKLKK